MAQIRTHYDNLKVARNAPPEVIRAAYRTLSQKYHPDRNPGNPESVRIMTILNNTYDVLSDPSKRREHDEWIRNGCCQSSAANTTACASLHATADTSTAASPQKYRYSSLFPCIKKLAYLRFSGYLYWGLAW